MLLCYYIFIGRWINITTLYILFGIYLILTPILLGVQAYISYRLFTSLCMSESSHTGVEYPDMPNIDDSSVIQPPHEYIQQTIDDDDNDSVEVITDDIEKYYDATRRRV